MTLRQVFTQIQKTELAPVITLIGPDGFIRQKALQVLLDRALDPGLREMNFAKFQGGEDALARVTDAAREFPCFAERRVIVLNQADKLKKKEAAEIIRYVKDPQSSTLLVLCAPKLDGRLEWVKVLKKNSLRFELPEPGMEDALAWVRKCFVREKKECEPGVPERLVDWFGTSFGTLEQRVIQLCLYGGDEPTITMSQVEGLFEKVSEENVFEVVEAIFRGDSAKLHHSLGRLLDSGEAPLKVLNLIYRHLCILLAMQGPGAEDSSRLFPLPPMVRRRYQEQSRRFGQSLSPRLLRPIAEADQGLKGSPLKKGLILQNCVEEIGRLLA